MQNSGETSFSGKMGTLTIDDQVLAALTEIADQEGISLDELVGRVLGDFAEKRQILKEEMTALILGMSNELLTPITAIMGYSQILIMQLSQLSESAIKDDLYAIHKYARHIYKVRNDGLHSAGIERGYFPIVLEIIDLNSFLQEQIETFRVFMKDGYIETKFSGEALPVYVHIDPKQFLIVLNEYITDAINAIQSSAVNVTTKIEGNKVNILIQHEQGNYEKATSFFNWDWLGMPVARYILEKHNAHATINQEGDGVTLTITLPIATSER